MARLARIMIAGWPFHLAHRGNHRNKVFHSDHDRVSYLKLLRRCAARFEMLVWAYCLMPNHVHIIAVGRQEISIARALGETQRLHSARKNRENRVTGHLWANRYFSTALDEPHLWAAVRYIELNPVRAGITTDPIDYRWSSARAHAGLVTDGLLDPDRPFPGPISDWAEWLRIGLDDDTIDRLRRNTHTGQPTGSEEFVTDIESRLQRKVHPSRRHRPKLADNQQ